MKTNKFLILTLTALTLLSSCESEDDTVQNPTNPDTGEAYSEGVFVLNEGGFGSGNSSVSFINSEMTEVSNNIFSEENSGAALGDVAQSIGFYEDYAFIVLNVSNKIEIVDRNTFKSVGAVTEGLQNPRYITFAEGKAYVTNWGDGTNPDDDFVAVIDAATFEIEENIAVVEGPEAIVENDGMLYVAHLGGYSFNDKISVINSADNSVSEIITVGDRPNSLEIENGSLWVVTGGLPSYSETETAGKIVKIDLATLEVATEYLFDNATDHPANLGLENGVVYYTLGKNVYSFNTEDEELPETEILELADVISLYGFEVKGDHIYAASANADFTGDGDLFIYNATTGILFESFEVGINPNGIYFNE